jgi:predicted negative regulator of RcsB-dependent stress response
LSTAPPGNLPASPAIPLPDDLRTAYENLYSLLETQYQSTADPVVLGAVGPARDNVGSILTKDDMYKESQDTAIFAALQTQITSANQGLQTLQTQIGATASHFAMAGDILAAITKVFTFFA